MVNVPTVVWIDEAGRIVRPNDVAFGTDTFRHVTGIEAARHQGALRAWVRGEAPVMDPARARELVALPTEPDQQARAEFGLGQWLHAAGRPAAPARHFPRARDPPPPHFTIPPPTTPP